MVVEDYALMLIFLTKELLVAACVYLNYNVAFSTFCLIFSCSTQTKKKKKRGVFLFFSQRAKTYKASSANITSHSISIAY